MLSLLNRIEYTEICYRSVKLPNFVVKCLFCNLIVFRAVVLFIVTCGAVEVII